MEASSYRTVTATFGISYENLVLYGTTRGTLTLLLVYNDSSEPLSTIGQALSGFTWTMNGFTGSLTATSAKVGAGSNLVGENLAEWIAAGGATGEFTDISGYWMFKDDVAGGTTYNGTPIGNYGVGSIGDINGGVDTFGNGDRIGTPYPNSAYHSGNGDFMIIPDELVLTDATKPWVDGFKRQGPMVQDSVLLTFEFDGDSLSKSMIGDGVFLFGTEGQPLVPEPGTIALVGAAFAAAVLVRRRRRAKRS